jgi:tagatose 1,6-diphosphate aldolase
MPNTNFPGLTTDIGILRALQTCTCEAGFFAVLAIDHPHSLILGDRDVDPGDPAVQQAAIAAKLDLTRGLAPFTSAVLVDVDMSLAGVISNGCLPGNIGLMIGIETQEYQLTLDPHIPTQFHPGWTPAKIKAAGGAGLKLLWHYRRDVPEAEANRELMRRVAAECRAVSLPLIAEPMWCLLPGEDINDPAIRTKFVEDVVAHAAECQGLGGDILKIEFPGWVDTAAERAAAAEACARVSATTSVPWMILSAGVTFEKYLVQCEIAAKAGASGYIAGRAVWECAASNDPTERATGIQVAAERLQKLNGVFEAFGKPLRFAGSAEDVEKIYPRYWFTDWHSQD